MTTPLANPGLDLDALRRMRAPRHNIVTILARIESHLDAYDGYLALSGGKDSVVVAHLARQVAPDVPMVFFDSGLEYPETYRYLEDLVEDWNLNLRIEPAERSLLDALIQDSAWDHSSRLPSAEDNLHDLLITAPAARAHQAFGPGELWGVRAEEANGRASLYATALARETRSHCHGCCTTTQQRRARHGGTIRRTDTTVAYGPIWDWKLDDVATYVAHHHIPLNPVYAKLAALGAPVQAQRVSHVLDGSRLEEGRATWLRAGWPSLFEELATLLPRLREFV